MGVTAVTLGTFYTDSSGKTLLGGAGGSGLDTQTLIKNLVAAKSQPITADQSIITSNNSQITALNSFQTKLSAFQQSADALRTAPGINTAATDAFQYTTASVGNGGSAYVSVATQPGAALQSYNISDISSVASAATQGTGTFNIASADADATVNNGSSYFHAGTIHFNGADITVNAGDSLSSIAATFNAAKATTGVAATVVAIDSTHYQLSFVATNTGDSHNFDVSGATDLSGVLTNVGITAPVTGTNAIFKLNNIPITRQSNSISDLIKNVTFTIIQKTPDAVTNYAATISPDTATVQSTINAFVSAYNDLKTFATQQTQLNAKGTYASGAVLANDQTFRQTMDAVNAQVVSQVAGIASGKYDNLSAIGITFTTQTATSTTPEVANVLSVNTGALTAALSSNFNDVKNLFGFNFTSDNPNLGVYKAPNSLGASAFTLTATVSLGPPDTSTFVATFDPATGLSPVTLTKTALAGTSGYSLVGPAGSALDGLQLIYASQATSTIHVTATQGIADQTFNTTNAATTATSGTLAVAIKAVQTNTTALNDDITRLNTLISQYQDQITKQFTALEQAISKANTLLQSLNANANAQLTSSGH